MAEGFVKVHFQTQLDYMRGMSLIGLIGGVSPEATKIYYQLLNRYARDHRGGQHSANVLFYMLDFGVMRSHYNVQDWDGFTAEVVKGALALKAGGAKAIAITSGTTHLAAEAVADATALPVIHMQDCLAEALDAVGCKRPLLTGTPWVMSGDFFVPELAQRYAGRPIIPSEADREMIGRVIFNELVEGIVTDVSHNEMTAMVKRYVDQGADGVILGCTELCMILQEADCSIPVLSTTHIHAGAIDKWINEERYAASTE